MDYVNEYVTKGLPPADALRSLDTAQLTAILDVLFEHSPALHAQSLEILRSRLYVSYDDAVAGVGQQLTALINSSSPSDKGCLEDILKSHPRLGAAKVDSAQSRAEQAQLKDDNEEIAARLHALNVEYEAKFPGLIYVVFVNGRSRPAIMEDMRARIDRGDIDEERRQAVQAMVDIAADRARKLSSKQ